MSVTREAVRAPRCLYRVQRQTRCLSQTVQRQRPAQPSIPTATPLPRQTQASPQAQTGRMPSALSSLLASAKPSPSQNPTPSLRTDTRAAMIRSAESKALRRNQEALAEMNQPFTTAELERQMTRKWGVGDVYAPHDLTGVEFSKWKKGAKPGKVKQDDLDRLNINPIKEYKNFAMMAGFVHDLGKIKHSSATGFRAVNQRRMAKAVKRAVGCGLLPRSYKHPELLKRERAWRQMLEDRQYVFGRR